MCIGASRVAVRAVMMRGAIVTGMIVVPVFARRHLGIAHDQCETAVDRRQHESRRNKRSQE